MNNNFFVMNVNSHYTYDGKTIYIENTLVFCGTYEECEEYTNNHRNHYEYSSSNEYFIMEFGKTVVTFN